jgi:protein ImuB
VRGDWGSGFIYPPRRRAGHSGCSSGRSRSRRWRKFPTGRRFASAAIEGPERIAAPWWRRFDAPTRDYFRAEDFSGRRYWLYREGLYGRETLRAKWFLHGVFA